MECSSEKGDVCLSDGKVSLLIRPCDTTSYRAMTEGLDHIGFKVENLERAKREIDQIGESSPDSAPKKVDLGRFGRVTKEELEGCILGKYAGADPDGILLDLSE